jgi:hypothetical protein
MSNFSENPTRLCVRRLVCPQLLAGHSHPDYGQLELELCAMSMLSFGERRDNPRQRLGRLATIKLGVGIEPRYVLVSNVSAEGVRLQLNGIEAVDEFVLLFHGNGAARDGTYRVVWRQGQDIGAKFISEATQSV